MRGSYKPTIYEQTRCDADRPTKRGKTKAIKRFPPYLRTFLGVPDSFRYGYRRQVLYNQDHLFLREYRSYIYLGNYSLFLPLVAEMPRALQARATLFRFSHYLHPSKFYFSFILCFDIDFLLVPAQVAMLPSR